MEKKKASEEIVEILRKQLGKKPEDVTPEKRIKEDLGADSLDVVEILMTVEDKYNVTVPDEELMAISTVADLVKMIDKIAK